MKKNPGLHLSKEYLKKRYIMDKRSPEDIAKECRVSVQLVYRQLKKFGLKK
jgi:transposase-like protein